MVEIQIGIDLSALDPKDLHKIYQTKGMPKNICFDAAMLAMLKEEGLPVTGQAEMSEQWTIPTSPRTKARIEKLVGK